MQHDEILTDATALQHGAIERIERGARPENQAQALLMAGLSLARIWMAPADVSSYLRQLADELENAAEESKRGSH